VIAFSLPFFLFFSKTLFADPISTKSCHWLQFCPFLSITRYSDESGRRSDAEEAAKAEGRRIRKKQWWSGG